MCYLLHHLPELAWFADHAVNLEHHLPDTILSSSRTLASACQHHSSRQSLPVSIDHLLSIPTYLTFIASISRHEELACWHHTYREITYLSSTQAYLTPLDSIILLRRPLTFLNTEDVHTIPVQDHFSEGHLPFHHTIKSLLLDTPFIKAFYGPFHE